MLSKKHSPQIETYRLVESRKMEKVIQHANNERKAGVATLILNKIYFRAEKITRDTKDVI